MSVSHDDLLTVADVAAWLKVDPRYVYRMTSSGVLGKVYVGRYLRIPEASVAAYLKARTVEAAPRPARRHRPGGRARRLRAVNDGQ